MGKRPTMERSMRVLVGLGSCIAYENNGYDDALRKTCLRQAHIKGVDYKVFIGDRLAITHNTSPQAWINFSPPPYVAFSK